MIKKYMISAVCTALVGTSVLSTSVAFADTEEKAVKAEVMEISVNLKEIPTFVEKEKTLKYVAAETLLNLRESAKTDAKVVDYLDTGLVLFVEEEKDGWAKVKAGENTGYVSSEYLEEVVNQKMYVEATGLNVRKAAKTDSELVTTLDQHDSIKVVVEENGWAEIEFDEGKKGFVSVEFLTSEKPVIDVEEQATATASSNGSSSNATSNSSSNSSSNSTSKPSKPSSSRPTPSPVGGSLISIAKSLIGSPYVFGASGPSSFDCSGFIAYTFKQAGRPVGRTSVAGYWSKAAKISNPVAGDLIFFQNTYKNGPSHMGIYLGGGQFIHASSSKGVTIDRTSNSYWSSKFLGYGRL